MSDQSDDAGAELDAEDAKLVTLARARDIPTIRGTYVPSPRNKIVAEHFATLGFECLWEREDGSTGWELDVSTFDPHPVPISIEES